MNESRQIPNEIRDDFEPLDLIDEHPGVLRAADPPGARHRLRGAS